MNTKLTNGLKLLTCGLLFLFATDLRAQLLFKTKFSAVEGYTNGWMIGQPATGGKWQNANDNYDFGGVNNGMSYTNADGTPWLMVTATNTAAPNGGAMMVASDGNQGTNNSVYYWRMKFPTTLVGPITVSWDWQYFPTNPIPTNFNPNINCPITEFGVAQPCTNDAGVNLQTTDIGFTLADSGNAGLGDNPNVVFNELSGITRLGGDQVADSRFNGVGACGGGGDWFKRGPRYQDGKLIHETMAVYVGLTGDGAETNNTFAVWANREGEEVFQTASPLEDPDYGLPDAPKPRPAFGMRRCPNEFAAANSLPETGIDCITLWMNSSADKLGTYVLVSNIRVVGPNPVTVPALNISQTGLVAFGGWLEAADAPQGPYTTVAVTSPYQVPPGTGTKFYRASN